jgi:cytochrome c oxidase assembly factor 2
MADGTQKRRRRRKCVEDKPAVEESAEEGEDSIVPSRKEKRECPVPKPGGLVGEILGFKPSSSDGKGSSKPP